VVPSASSKTNNYDTETSQIQSKAFFRDSVLWPNNKIKVCWVDVDNYDSFSHERGLVKEAITKSWQAHSLLEVTGWENKCPFHNPLSPFDGIRIVASDEAYSALGTEGKGILNGTMHLDFALNTGAVSWAENKTTAQLCHANGGKTFDQCIEWMATHEFGHAIGMAHEANRPIDHINSGCHKKDPEFTPLPIFVPNIFSLWGNTYFTDYDQDSIMNRCRDGYFGNANLSKMDIIALKTYYGNIPEYNANTQTLLIPRLMDEDGVPHRATLKYDGTKFTLIEYITTQEESSVHSIFSAESIAILPLVKVIQAGHVTSLIQAQLWTVDNVTFTLTKFEVHPDSKI